MISRFLTLTLLSFALCQSAAAQELTQELLEEVVQGSGKVFRKVECPGDGEVKEVVLNLGEDSSVKGEGFHFDGFRFTTPANITGDFVWYFNAPTDWGQWYIMPSEGKPERAFRTWVDGDKVYQKFDELGETGRTRILQTLGQSYFQPNREYIMWFREVNEGGTKPQTLRATFAFAQREKEGEAGEHWEAEEIEEALGLVPHPAEEQVAVLNSRGGRILFDQTFFTRDYGEDRIDHVFFTRRQTRQTRGGFFITMQIATPPCRTEPSLVEIQKKYGEADFVRSAVELKKLGREPEDINVVTHYYDYLGFEIDSRDPEKKVLRVRAQANDFSVVNPEMEGGAEKSATFHTISMENLTVFRTGGKEVGRIYFFREGDKEPNIIVEPPKGKYRRGVGTLEYLGDGKWDEKYWSEDEKMVRHFVYESHQLNGLSTGFRENGDPLFRAEYKNGLLEGELIEYSEDGAETKTMFREGSRVE